MLLVYLTYFLNVDFRIRRLYNTTRKFKSVFELNAPLKKYRFKKINPVSIQI